MGPLCALRTQHDHGLSNQEAALAPCHDEGTVAALPARRRYLCGVDHSGAVLSPDGQTLYNAQQRQQYRRRESHHLEF